LTGADWLAVIRPRLTEPLFGEPAVRRLLRAARHLPATGLAALEVRLGREPGPVDLSLRLSEPASALEAAERPLPAHLRSFLAVWAEPGGPFAQVPCVWLEFDLDRDRRALPVPTVCSRLPHAVDTGWLLDSLWPAMHGRPLTRLQREIARRCRELLPPSANLLYAFSLLSRPGGAVRLEASGLEPWLVVEYLRRVAPAVLPEVEAALPLFAGVEWLHLSFDIASEILPRIGIEGSFPNPPGREPRWRGLFDRLVDRGLCTPEKREAVLAWPGYDSFWTAPGRWPEEAGLRAACVRALSHVKLVCQPGREPEAKAYLTLGSLDRLGAGAAASSPASLSARAT
jgi:hypothetical protein